MDKYAEVKTQVGDLKVKAEELKSKAVESYNMAVSEYERLVAEGQKMIQTLDTLLEKTTIADIVEYVQAKFEEAQTKAMELKSQAEELYKTNVELAKTMMKEYETQAKEMILKYRVQAEAMYAQYKTKAVVEYKKALKQLEKFYEANVEPMVEEYRTKVMEQYKKLRPQFDAKYNELKNQYMELKEQAMTKYQLYRQEGEQLLKAFKVKAVEFYKKTSEDLYKRVMDSELRRQLMSIQKMTIKQTIEILKKMPQEIQLLVQETQEMVQGMLNAYSKRAVAEYNKQYKKVYDEYSKQYKQLKVKSDKMIAEYQQRRAELIKMMKPIMEPIVDAYKWVENEITETAVFVYRYHRIEESADALKTMVVAEYQRLRPIVQAEIEKFQRELMAEYQKKVEEYKQVAEQYKEMAAEYRVKGKDMAYDAITTAGDKTLRGIHSGLQYVDNIDFSKIDLSMFDFSKIQFPDMSKLSKQARAYLTEINKYVSIEDGKIMINIPHGEIRPMINAQYKKIAQLSERTVKIAKQELKKMMKKVKAELKTVQARADVLRQRLTRAVMANTVELRTDLRKSFTINNRIAQRVYDNAKLWGQKTYRKAMTEYKKVRSQATSYINKAKKMAQKYYNTMVKSAQKAYLKSSEIVMDIYNVGLKKMHKRAYFHAQKYYTMAGRQYNKMVKQYKPVAMKMYNKYTKMVKSQYIQTKKDVLPYYRAMKKAYTDIKMGVSVQKAMKPVLRQIVFVSREYQRQAIKSLSKAKSMFCKRDPKLCKHLNEASRIHKKLFNKYYERAAEIVAVSKARFDRSIRMLSRYTNQPIFGDYNVAALMFDNTVLTFDKTYFQMGEGSEDCSYLLAHDFAENQFTVKKEGQSIVIETPEMTVSIKKNGQIRATVGNEVTKTLPVESSTGHCIRKDNKIICNLENLKVVVDLENEITTLSVSGWYFGRTRGIFGTFNRESYDDLKLPTGKLTNNVYEFLNKYELSGKKQCQLKPVKATKKTCNNPPSYRCQKLFNEASSPLAQYFDIVDPEPFWDACIADTRSCDGKIPSYDAYCKSVAAFFSIGRSMGQWIEYPESCVKYENYRIGEEFKQKPSKKQMDVVVLVSQQESQRQYMDKSVNEFFKLLNRMLNKRNKLNVKYAVVGFGGAGIQEEAHVKSFNKHAFNKLPEALKIIKTMKFNGAEENSNDAFMAISEAAQLPFRAGASKMFILFNAQKHSAHQLGSTLDEARYALAKELDASLVTFESVDFKNRNAFGQSNRKLYTNKKSINGKFTSPNSEYTKLVEESNGGHFKKDIRNIKQAANAVHDIAKNTVKRNNQKCRLCKVVASWDQSAKTICQPIKC